jgi:septum formation protein
MNRMEISEKKPLVLASASPRRKRLIEQAGLPFIIVVSNIDETLDGDDPAAGARTLARRKADAVRDSYPGRWILGADTIVVQGTSILGKPFDPRDARVMLERLSGKEHSVITGFCIAGPGGAYYSEAVRTLVKFKELTQREVEGYIETDEPFGKAGSYAIQGIGVFLVESIKGSYTNVVGLPLCEVISALVKMGALERYPLHVKKTNL